MRDELKAEDGQLSESEGRKYLLEEMQDPEWVEAEDGKCLFYEREGQYFVELGSYLCSFGKALGDRNGEEFVNALRALDNLLNNENEPLMRLLILTGVVGPTREPDLEITPDDPSLVIDFAMRCLEYARALYEDDEEKAGQVLRHIEDFMSPCEESECGTEQAE